MASTLNPWPFASFFLTIEFDGFKLARGNTSDCRFPVFDPRAQAVRGVIGPQERGDMAFTDKLGYLPGWTENRRKNAYLYNKYLEDSNLITPVEIDDVKAIFSLIK